VQNRSFLKALCGTALTSGFLFFPGAAHSIIPAQTAQTSLSGIWELSVGGANSKCRLALQMKLEPSSNLQPVRIPLACLRVLPALVDVNGWAVTTDGHLQLDDRGGRAILDFTERGSGEFSASGPQGEVYLRSAASGGLTNEETRPAPVGKANAAVNPVPKEDRVAAAADGAAGRYSILREGGKDTGCMLTLADPGHVKGAAKALLAPACRDQGMVIFDPVSWQLISGRLVLTARKGHKAHFDPQPDGTWKKDPAEGKSLTLKKQS